MSQIQVTTLEANNLSAPSITAGQTTVNSSGLYLNSTSGVINTSAIVVANSSGNVALRGTINVPYIFIGNTNVFPNSNDVYAWAGAATTNNNCLVSRDTSIEISPFGGIPMKIVPTGTDPFPGTYNTSQWNLAPTINGDIWKISGYIRSSADITIGDSTTLLVLPANSSGVYGTAGTANNLYALTLQGNTWTRFEFLSIITGNANTAYLQIRPDGEQTGTVTIWYDGITIQKAYRTLINEAVNTQIFTANGTWTKPGWANTGNELVVVHMWGGGGGGFANSTYYSGGGGGAFVFGYFKSSQCNATCNVVVGAEGVKGNTASVASAATAGGNSVFWPNTTNSLTAYGGGPGTGTSSPSMGGGGWFGTSNTTFGGAPLGGAVGGTGGDSTFGGGGGYNGSPFKGGNSIYGGGGGSGSNVSGGSSVYGGGGGSSWGPNGPGIPGTSVYGGAGGNSSVSGFIPGGGGGAGNVSSMFATNGARGEVRIYTYRILA